MADSCSEKALILYALHELHKQVSPKFEKCTGISQSRLDLLHELCQADEISQTALQKEVNIDSAAVTRHLKQLETAGMVSRRRNPDDNRITLVKLTDHGRNEIISMRDEKAYFVAQMLDGFSSEECNQLLDMLNRMQNNIKHIRS
ncbi:MarR family winged helix-turn-helix transcriptional regulator [Peribacillus sp. B-H-3]|uniref:MarR family winged helix-turn-helix transcriptional regulator n=1 Tax=Peribacillus sp. B-H-3 TaxID=3400420 RepID=UPI003B02C190